MHQLTDGSACKPRTRDKPSAIDYAKLTRMTQWMCVTGWLVASTPKRPGIDPGFKLER